MTLNEFIEAGSDALCEEARGESNPLIGIYRVWERMWDAATLAATAAERERCLGLVETRRRKVLANPADPSWTEHFAELGNAIRFPSAPDDTALAPTTPDVLDCNDADPEPT